MTLRATQQEQQLDDIPRAADWYRSLLTGSQVCLLASGAVTISGVEIAPMSGDYFGVAIVGIGSEFGLGVTFLRNMSSGLSLTSKLDLRWMLMA
jgi:hypothetical protein